MNKYWASMTAGERSAEMKRRRAKSAKIAGGLHYVDEAQRKSLLEKARQAKHEKNSPKGQDESKGSEVPKETAQT